MLLFKKSWTGIEMCYKSDMCIYSSCFLSSVLPGALLLFPVSGCQRSERKCRINTPVIYQRAQIHMVQRITGVHQHHHKTTNLKCCRRLIPPEKARKRARWESSKPGGPASRGSQTRKLKPRQKGPSSHFTQRFNQTQAPWLSIFFTG